MKSEHGDNKLRLSLGMKCGDCIHFDLTKASVYADTCGELGVKRFAKACEHFTPDSSRLSRIESAAMLSLAAISKEADPAQLRLLAYTLKNMTFIKRLGFEFGEQVWFNLSAPKVDYLECYYTGFIVAADEHEDTMYISSTLDGKSRANVMLPLDSILSLDMWAKRKKRLIRNGLIAIPRASLDSRIRLVAPKPTAEDDNDYEVPTLESAPKAWLAAAQTDDGELEDNPNVGHEGDEDEEDDSDLEVSRRGAVTTLSFN